MCQIKCRDFTFSMISTHNTSFLHKNHFIDHHMTHCMKYKRQTIQHYCCLNITNILLTTFIMETPPHPRHLIQYTKLSTSQPHSYQLLQISNVMLFIRKGKGRIEFESTLGVVNLSLDIKNVANWLIFLHMRRSISTALLNLMLTHIITMNRVSLSTN